MIPDRLTTSASQKVADEHAERYWEHRDYPDDDSEESEE